MISISRTVDKVANDRRDAPFVVRYTTADGEHEVQARSVIDASGTWLTPNPLGANGTPALGEDRHRDRLYYGIPDVLGADRDSYANRTVAVVGSGHSAANAVLALLALRTDHPRTEIHWVIRGSKLRAADGSSADQFVARGRLGAAAGEAVESGAVRLHEGFPVRAIRTVEGRLELVGDGRRLSGIDEIVVATGQRPDRALAEELRLDLDKALGRGHLPSGVRTFDERRPATPTGGACAASGSSSTRGPNALDGAVAPTKPIARSAAPDVGSIDVAAAEARGPGCLLNRNRSQARGSTAGESANHRTPSITGSPYWWPVRAAGRLYQTPP